MNEQLPETTSFPEHPWDEYQEWAAQHSVEHGGRTLIRLKPGRGKTMVALEVSRRLECKTLLIVCSNNALYTWVKHIEKYFPEYFSDLMLLTGKQSSTSLRKLTWRNPPKVIITSYGVIQRDWDTIKRIGCRWDMIITDEFHRYSRSRHTKTIKGLRSIGRQSKHFIALTGTPPLSKGPQQLWAILSVLRRDVYTSFWKWVHKYQYVIDGPFGKIVQGVKNKEALNEELRQIMFNLDTDEGAPEKRRHQLFVEMEPRQAKLQEDLLEDLIAISEDSLIIAPDKMVAIIRIRQSLACPAILSPNLGVGPGIKAVVDHIQDRDDGDHEVKSAIFTPFIPAIEEFRKYLDSLSNPDFKIFTFMGGMDFDQLRDAEEGFRAAEGMVVALCSTTYAQSYELETAPVSYHIGYDWDPDTMNQCEGRIERRTSEFGMVNHYYVSHINSYDEDVLNILHSKSGNIHAVLRDPGWVKQHILRKKEGE